MSELETCPFCQSDKAIVIMIRDGRKAVCGQCGGSGPSAHHGPNTMPSAHERAVTAWNTRAPDPKAEALAEALGGCIGALVALGLSGGPNATKARAALAAYRGRP